MDELRQIINSLSKGATRHLSYDEERELLRQAKSEDKKLAERARDRLIQSHSLLAAKLAKRHYRQLMRFSTKSASVDDLFQAGVSGLMLAIQNFDVNYPNRFSTYATWWMRSEMYKLLIDNFQSVRIPFSGAGARRFFIHYYRVKEELTRDDPSMHGEKLIDALAKKLQIHPERIRHYLPFMDQTTMSLETPMGQEDDGSFTLQDIIPDKDSLSPEEATEMSVKSDKLKDILRRGMRMLQPRDRLVIQQRYLDEPHKTLDEVAQQLGISRERVRQLEVRGLRDLRRGMTVKRSDVQLIEEY